MTDLRTLTTRHAPDTDRADDWRDSAACLGVEPELFYPAGSKWVRHPDQQAAALAICARCGVREACLRFAMDVGDEWAILGGTTPEQRRSARRREQRRKAATS